MADVTGADEALGRAVQAVYAVEPAEFVATRKEWVARLRSEGLRDVAKQVAALRKPSVSAAAVNALVRADDPVVARLEDVGAKMRHAQSTLDAAALSALRDDRDELLAAWVAAAREHATSALTAAVEAEVRDTAVAALADPAATEVVTSGSLTRALSYSGFGEVDIADAVARTSTGVVLTRIEGGRADEVERGDEEYDGEEHEGVVEESGELKVEVEDEVEDFEVETEPEDEAEVEPEEDDADGDEAPAEEPEDTEPLAETISALEMELDEAEKVVAAARAARRTAATEHEAAEEQASAAAEQLEQAELLLAKARGAVTDAEEERDRTASALAEADEELRRSRRQRDAARAALEEAEDG